MDAKEFVSGAAILDEVIMRGPHLLCAKREMVGEVPHVLFRFNVDPPMRTVHFSTVAACDLLWDEFVRIMVQMCKPPCIRIGTVIFQPAYLSRFFSYSDQRGHFIVLDFGNNRNLGIGFLDSMKRDRMFMSLEAVLAARIKGAPPPTVK